MEDETDKYIVEEKKRQKRMNEERRERYKNYALAFMTGIVVGVLIS